MSSVVRGIQEICIWYEEIWNTVPLKMIQVFIVLEERKLCVDERSTENRQFV